MLLCHISLVLNSPSSHVILDAFISSCKHPIVLFFSKEDVRLKQVLIEGVHTSSKTTLLANPLACLDINYIA